MLNTNYFKELAKEHYGVDVQKVSFGDVMFLIEKEKAGLDARIQAITEMQIEYKNEGDMVMYEVCNAKIECYLINIESLNEIQSAIYKKVL
ncbi:MAG: hypothetical protein ACXADW_12785 [Candidatus Hodarchaeales archaeon]|jgi:hypothetical protein